jgi:hypothetical protein
MKHLQFFKIFGSPCRSYESMSKLGALTVVIYNIVSQVLAISFLILIHLCTNKNCNGTVDSNLALTHNNYVKINKPIKIKFSFVYIFGELECVGHSFAYVAHFVFLRDVWIRPRELPFQAGYQLSRPSP